MTTEENNIPFDPARRTAGDHAHLAVQAAVNAIPFVGGSLAVLANELIASPARKRQDDFYRQVAVDIEKLKATSQLDVATLKNSPAFISAVITASTLAIQTGEPEKLDALRASLINTAKQQDSDEAYNQMLIGTLREMTGIHIKLINFFENRDYESVRQKGKNNTPLRQQDFDAEVRPLFANDFPIYIIHRACKELEAAGLIAVPDGFASQMSAPNYVTMLLTPFGSVFAKFITLPTDADFDIAVLKE